MKVKVYNQAGETVGEQELDPAIFGVKAKDALVHQVVVALQNNARQILAHTKGRGEVRGGGRKPWQQKGTGRARAGSTRSPIWKGGGVTFGPTKDRNFKQKINKKMKLKVLLMCLSDKAVNNNLIILDKLELAEIKTKKLNEILKKLPLAVDKILLVLPGSDEKLLRSARNLTKLKLTRADNLNVLDVLGAKTLLMVQASLPVINKFYKK